MGILKKLVILYVLSCFVDDKHEKFRTLLAHMPRKDAVGLTMVEKLPVFKTTRDSLRVYQITDRQTFITAYVQPSETGWLGTLVRCDLYKDRSRDVMVTSLTDYGWKDEDTVMNVVTDADDVWRYSYLLDSCFWHRRGRHFDELAELPPPDALTWLLQVGRNVYKTTASFLKDAGRPIEKATDPRKNDDTPRTTLTTVKEYVTETFWPEDAKSVNHHDSAKDEDATRGWFDKLCRSVGVATSGDVTPTVRTGQTSEGQTESQETGHDEFTTGWWYWTPSTTS
ncbi:Hypp6345 [Branchiostoma lanceolatum]|uniref:Hypp6345 protein n=1 Tax=Branchiostoma lanceolatum TaxID=7740 RepID=A0A8K0E9I8_BRALA|nr:Hypp6345 [Branchiostoma lanceolatum]